MAGAVTPSSHIKSYEPARERIGDAGITAAAIPMAVGAIAALAALLYGGRFAGDDTYIYMRYVGNLLTGNGFSFNPHEASFGVTSPLWTFVMVPVAYVFGNTVLVWKVTGVVFLGLATCTLCVFLRRHFALTVPAGIALSLLGVMEPQSFRWSSSGMENALALFLLALTASCYLTLLDGGGGLARGNAAAAMTGIALGLLPFARPEFAVLAMALWCYLVYRGYREIAGGRGLSAGWMWVALAAGLLTMACLALISRVAFGAFIPQTAAAKALLTRQGGLYGTVQSLKIVFGGSLGAVLLWLNMRRHAPAIWAFFAAVCAGVTISVAYLGYQNQLVSTRYATNLSAPIVLAAAIGLAATLQAAAGKSRQRLNWILAGSQVLLFAAVLVYVFPATRTSEGEDIRAVADMVKKASADSGHAPRVALTEVGAFGFYSQAYVIDLVGLTDTATLAWAQKNGALSNPDSLEALLVARKAEYYIVDHGDDLTRGRQLNFVLVGEGRVRRANYSQGYINADRWRVYKLEPVTASSASSPATF